MWKLICVLLAIASGSVIGVDLGSELIKVNHIQTSLIRPGKKLLIVENEQSKRSTPMAVSFTDQGREYGYNAIREQVKKPEATVLYSHNLISSLNTNYFLRTFQPLQTIENTDRNSTLLTIGKETYEIEEIVAMILEYVKEMSEKFGDGIIQDCTITVPSFWNRSQRLALISAAQAAGLNVLALIHENTGAAFYYAIDRLDNETDHYALFYNLGSSYLQVTLAKYSSAKKTGGKALENVEILAHASDSSLGGSLFDSLIANYLAQKFKDIHKHDITAVPKSMVRLFQQANQAKKTLSANKSVFIIVNSLYKGIDFKYTMTRDEFENLIQPYVERLTKPLNEVLEKSNIELSQINTLEIIGGVSRIPKVQELLKEKTGIEVSTHLNGDESMAHGAAIYAANFSSVIQVKPLWLTDITTKVYSAKFYSVDDSGWAKETVLFNEGAKLGSRKKVTFAYNQDIFVFIEEAVGDEKIPLCFYDIKGVSDLERDEVNLFFSFVLDYSGIPFLSTADAKYERRRKVVQESYEVEGSEEEKIGENEESNESSDDKNIEKDEKSEENSEGNEKSEENIERDQESTEEKVENSEKDRESSEEKQENSENSNEESSSTKDQDSKKDTEGKTTNKDPKKKDTTKTISLKLKEVELEQPRPLTSKEISRIIKRLGDLKESEVQAKKIAEAKNDIESYIYYISDKLEDDNFSKVSSYDEREKLSEKTSELRIWIESDEFEIAKASEIKKKKRELESLITDALQREKELELREQAVENAYKQIGRLQDTLIKINETKSWISPEEIQLAWGRLNDTIKWVDTKIEEQAKLADWEPLAFRISELEVKVGAVEKQIEKLNKTPKPKSSTGGGSGGSSGSGSSGSGGSKSGGKSGGKKPNVPDFMNFGEGFDWSKVKMDNVKVDGEEFNFDPEKDLPKDNSDNEKPEVDEGIKGKDEAKTDL